MSDGNTNSRKPSGQRIDELVRAAEQCLCSVPGSELFERLQSWARLDAETAAHYFEALRNARMDDSFRRTAVESFAVDLRKMLEVRQATFVEMKATAIEDLITRKAVETWRRPFRWLFNVESDLRRLEDVLEGLLNAEPTSADFYRFEVFARHQHKEELFPLFDSALDRARSDESFRGEIKEEVLDRFLNWSPSEAPTPRRELFFAASVGFVFFAAIDLFRSRFPIRQYPIDDSRDGLSVGGPTPLDIAQPHERALRAFESLAPTDKAIILHLVTNYGHEHIRVSDKLQRTAVDLHVSLRTVQRALKHERDAIDRELSSDSTRPRRRPGGHDKSA